MKRIIILLVALISISLGVKGQQGEKNLYYGQVGYNAIIRGKSYVATSQIYTTPDSLGIVWWKLLKDSLAAVRGAISGNTSQTYTYAQLRSLGTGSISASNLYSVYDNGIPAIFVWNPLSTATDDSAMAIKNVNFVTGRFLRWFESDIDVSWFGAVGDGITDDSYYFQKCANWIMTTGLCGNMLIPAKIYKLNRGIFFGIDRNHDGQWDFVTINIHGTKNSLGARGSNGGETTIIVNEDVGFGFGLQNNKGSQVSGISFQGNNFAPYSVDGFSIGLSTFNWVSPGLRDNQHSPNAGVVIDPVCRPYLPGTSWMYPNWIPYYTETIDNGSSDVQITNCSFYQLVVGIMNSPTGIKQNAEAMVFTNIWCSALKSGIANGQSQARTVYCNNIKLWSGIEVAFDAERYGADAGQSGLYVNGANIAGWVKWLCANNHFGIGSLNVFRDVHAELLFGLGGALFAYHTGGDVKIDNCQLDIIGTAPNNAERGNTLGWFTELILDHSIVIRYSHQDPSPMWVQCRFMEVRNSQCELYSSGFGVSQTSNMVEHSNISEAEMRFQGSHIFQNSDVALGGTMPVRNGDEVTDNLLDVAQNGLGYNVYRKFNGHTLSNQPVHIDSIHSISADSFTMVLVVQPSDINKIPLNSTLTGAFPDEVHGYDIETAFGYVSLIDKSTNRITVDYVNRYAKANFISGTLYIHLPNSLSLYPWFQVGDIVSGDTVIRNIQGEKTQLSLVVNQFIVHPAFPPGSWVKSVGTDSAVISMAATYSQSNAFLSNDINWQSTGYGGAPMVDTTNGSAKYAYKRGDIIRNIVIGNNTDYDSTISHWVCIKDGILSVTGRQPVFKAVYNSLVTGDGTIAPKIQTLVDQPTISFNLDSGRDATVAIYADREINITNAQTPDYVILNVIGGVAGATINLPGYQNLEFQFSDYLHGLTQIHGRYDGANWFWNSVLFGAVPVYESETIAYANAIGGLQTWQLYYVNNLVLTMKAIGWSKFHLVNPHMGTTGTTQMYNLCNPVNSDAAFRYVYNGGYTFDSTGAQPNGTNAYADSKFHVETPSDLPDVNSFTIGAYTSTNTAPGPGNDYFLFGVANSTDVIQWDNYNADQQYMILGDNININPSGITDWRGLCVVQRTANNSAKVWQRGSQVGSTQTTVRTGTPGVYSLYFSALNNNGNAVFFGNYKMQFEFVADGLTDPELATFTTAVNTFVAATK